MSRLSIAVTSPTPCEGCTALSPTLKSGAGTSGSGAMAIPGGGPGRPDGRVRTICGGGGGVMAGAGAAVADAEDPARRGAAAAMGAAAALLAERFGSVLALDLAALVEAGERLEAAPRAGAEPVRAG